MNNDSKILQKQFWEYVCTYAVSYLGGTISGVIDGFFASRFMSTSELAAFGLCSPFFSIVAMIGSIFALGMQNECAKKLSSGDKDSSTRAFSFVIELVFAATIILTLAGLYLMSGLCSTLGAGGANQYLAGGVREYSIGFIPGLSPLLLCTILPVAMNICGGKKYVMRATAVQSIADIVLDYLFVYVFDWGLTGLALASSAAALCSLLIMLVFMFFKQKMFGFRFIFPSWGLLRTVTRGGIPSFIRKLSMVVATVVVNRFFLMCGSELMASKSVVNTAATFFSAGMVGISGAMFLMAQILFQEKNKKRIRWLIRTTLSSICIMGVSTVLLLIVFAPFIMKVFKADPTIHEYAVAGFRLYVIALPFKGLTDGLFKYIQAAGQFTMSKVYAVIGQLVLIAAAYPMTLMFDSTGIWLSFTAAEIVTLLIYLVKNLISVKFSGRKFTDSVFLFSEELNEISRNSMEFIVHSDEDAGSRSEYVWQYLKLRKTDDVSAGFAALGIEEMTALFKEEAAKDEKRHECMIFMLCDHDGILLHFRDDCPLSDLDQRHEDAKDCKDLSENIGIRILFGIADDIEYSSVMNLNTVVIKIRKRDH